MSSTFPGAIDVLTNPAPTDKVAVVSHAANHSKANDCILAIETTLGINPQSAYGSVSLRLAAMMVMLGELDDAVIFDPVAEGMPEGGQLFYFEGEWRGELLQIGGDYSSRPEFGSFGVRMYHDNEAAFNLALPLGGLYWVTDYVDGTQLRVVQADGNAIDETLYVLTNLSTIRSRIVYQDHVILIDDLTLSSGYNGYDIYNKKPGGGGSLIITIPADTTENLAVGYNVFIAPYADVDEVGVGPIELMCESGSVRLNGSSGGTITVGSDPGPCWIRLRKTANNNWMASWATN